MTQDKYEYYINKTKEDFPSIISKTQKELDNSKSKSEDLYILNIFWDKFSEKAINKWDDSSTLFLDDKALQPMPESVSKQFVNMLFKVNNLDVLTDLDIYEGFEDYVDYDGFSKEEVINYYETNKFNTKEEDYAR